MLTISVEAIIGDAGEIPQLPGLMPFQITAFHFNRVINSVCTAHSSHGAFPVFILSLLSLSAHSQGEIFACYFTEATDHDPFNFLSLPASKHICISAILVSFSLVLNKRGRRRPSFISELSYILFSGYTSSFTSPWTKSIYFPPDRHLNLQCLPLCFNI